MINNFYSLYGKRLLDIVLIIPACLLLIPLYLVLGTGIVIFDGWPVLYTQDRVGKNFRKFTLYKFRTMTPDRTGKASLVTVKNDTRITPIGRFMRNYKLDELPQLFNVLIGNMSIVGPRPEVGKYVDQYKDDYKSVLSVKPGLADYATLMFHNEEEILSKYDNLQEAYINKILPEKIRLYKKYIADQSLITDLKIIVKTLRNIVG